VDQATRPLPDFSSLVEQYGPAVVDISTTQKVSAQERLQAAIERIEIPGTPRVVLSRHEQTFTV
jgi:S1-C subfamily serine protease